MHIAQTENQNLLESPERELIQTQASQRAPGPITLRRFCNSTRTWFGNPLTASVSAVFCGASAATGSPVAVITIAALTALSSNAVEVYNSAVDNNFPRARLLTYGAGLTAISGIGIAISYALTYGILQAGR